MRIVNCKVISVIICVLIGFVFVENIVLMLINYHLYNDVKLKSPADVFMNVVPRDVAGLTGNYTKVPIAVQRVLIEVVVNNSDVAGGRTRASVKSNKAHHSRDLSGIVSENHTLSRPLPPRLNDGENSTISLATNFTPFLDLLTNEDHNIISILKCWKNLTVPFLDKATPALRLIPPSFPAIPFYCKKYHKKNIECLKLESRGLSSWELNGNHIMLTVRTTTSLHASRLPLLFQTWMTAANRSNIFIVTDGRDKVLECRTREAGIHHVISVPGYKRLCEKAGDEISLMFKPENYHYDWFCHIDDDIYVNLAVLVQTLAKFQRKDPIYFGRAGDRHKVSEGCVYGFHGEVYHFALGGMYCLNRVMVERTSHWIGNGKAFSRTCNQSGETAEDVTVGLVVEVLLKEKLMNTELIHTHGMDLRGMVNPRTLKNQVAFAYGYGSMKWSSKKHNAIYVPHHIFSLPSDPSQFLSLHCHYFPSIGWCNKTNRTH